MIEVRKYRNTRFWAVYVDGELLAVVVYRKGAMAVAGRLDQHMAQPGAGAEQRIHGDANLLGDLVGGFEADAVDVLCQAVWVGLDFVDCALDIGLVDAHRPAGADAVAVEEHHDLADHLLLGPGFLNPGPALRPDTIYVL